ncbi:hypothetical protein GWN26_10575 [Candidatus Saccharibacteria bacterium]|nr:hypothetical protein [Candidatus Saccharibacteria bacterium]
MKRPVRIKAIIEALEFLSGDTEIYLNTKTGEVVTLPAKAEEETKPGEDREDFSELEDEILEKSREEVCSDEYILMPQRLEINELNLMENFCNGIKEEKLHDMMCEEIHHRDAYQRFKEKIYRFGLADKWYQYREQMLRQQAIEWCERQGIIYVDE